MSWATGPTVTGEVGRRARVAVDQTEGSNLSVDVLAEAVGESRKLKVTLATKLAGSNQPAIGGSADRVIEDGQTVLVESQPLPDGNAGSDARRLLTFVKLFLVDPAGNPIHPAPTAMNAAMRNRYGLQSPGLEPPSKRSSPDSTNAFQVAGSNSTPNPSAHMNQAMLDRYFPGWRTGPALRNRNNLPDPPQTPGKAAANQANNPPDSTSQAVRKRYGLPDAPANP